MTIRSALARAYHATPWGTPPEDPNPFPVDAWSDDRYAEWLEAHHATDAELAAQRATTFENGPLFSLIVPLFRTPLAFLDDMAASVLAQTYSRFELILVNASPEDTALAARAAEIATGDERVRVIPLEGNFGITENTLRGIDAATGDFIGFLDHDDIIEPDLLFEYARAIERKPCTDMLYCDEDLFEDTPEGRVFAHPTFKTAYAPELLLSKNYVVHLLCIRASVLASIPRPTSAVDAAQDYYFTLHAARAAREVANVERVLYHFRQSATSTAGNIYSKPYGKRAATNLITDWIASEPASAHITRTAHPDIYGLWFAPLSAARVSIVMIDPTALGDTFSIAYCAEQIAHANLGAGIEIVAVSPCAENDALANAAVPVKLVTCAADSSAFTRANQGAAAASGDALVFMHARDIFIGPDPISQFAGLLTMNGIGVAAPKVVYLDGTVRSFGAAVTEAGIFPIGRGYPQNHPGYLCSMDALANRSAVELHGLSVLKCVFDQAGGFDERFASEIGTAEFCTRVRKLGLRIAATPTVVLQTAQAAPEHCYVSAENAADYAPADLPLFDSVHPGLRAAGDPYYNSNLCQENGYSQLDMPTQPNAD